MEATSADRPRRHRSPWQGARPRLAVSLTVFALLPLAGSGCAVSDMRPVDLRCEYRADPPAVDVASPRLSWTLESDRRGCNQAAYRVLVASSEERLRSDHGDLWDTGKVPSSRSAQVSYAGKALASDQPCHWKVRVWDDTGKASSWSRPAHWTMGLLRPDDWQARWITDDQPTPSSLRDSQWVWFPEGNPVERAPVASRYFRRTVAIPSDRRIKQARFLLAADNRFELFVNARPAGRREGWEALSLLDVTKLLRPGTNAVAILATNGGTSPNPAGLIGRLSIELDNDQCIDVPIDATWKASDKEQTSWKRPDFDDTAWPAARVLGKVGIEPWGTPKVTNTPLPLFRREFTVDKPIRRARVHVCGLGFYELHVNGRRVGDHVIDPGWTNYRKRCLYATYDVTDRLTRGANALGVLLGNGMYNVTGGRYVKFTGSFGPPKLLLQLQIDYADGTSSRIVTDETWKAAPGPIVFSCIYGGEDYDARLEQPRWDQPGFDDGAWRAAEIAPGPGGTLSAQMAPPIKVMQTIKPVKVNEPRPGVLVYDLGQNFSGWPKIAVKGPTGARVTLTPAELLDDGGLANQRSSGRPCTFTYTLKGRGVETWHPRFTYYGFRYVQVDGAIRPEPRPGNPTDKPTLLSVEGQFLCNSAETVGRFACSHPLLNRIHEIINWAIRSNMQSVLTDCPHREKLGWLEEAHLMGPSILYNYDVPALYTKVFRDMAEAQLDNGLVPDIAPEYTVFRGGFRDSPEWGSAYVIAPWYVYRTYGDDRVLREHYEGMKRYVAYLGSRAQGNIVNHGLGDWCDIGPKSPGRSQLTPIALTATAVYYYDVTILQQVAEVLGKAAEVKRHAALAKQIREAFNRKFFKPQTNQYATGSQTSNAMALVLDLVPQEAAPAVLANLVKDVRDHGNHMTAGDVGHRFLLLALANGGRSDVVFDMTRHTDAPSYGHQIRHGATSLTEAWDGRRGLSQNHFMLGHVEEWFYKYLAGIRPDPASSGFERVVIQPHVVGDLTWVKARYRSIRGPIEVHWRRGGGTLTLEVAIPANVTATVHVPTTSPDAVTEGGVQAGKSDAVKFLRAEGGAAVYRIGSGRYCFTAPMR